MKRTVQLANTKVGDGISAGHGEWSFSKDVAKTFVSHIERSVPQYREGHDLICRVSEYFIGQKSLAYEVGTATGELLEKLVAYNASKPESRWVGIDHEKSMVEQARLHCAHHPNVSILHEDVTGYSFEPCDLIVAHYCVQFIPPRVRQAFIDRLYQALHWGGALIMFEKVRAPDARFQDMATGLYADFKREHGYSDEEIMAKSRSLRGVLEPFSSQANFDLLSRAGFVDIWPVMKYVCFEGVVAIK